MPIPMLTPELRALYRGPGRDVAQSHAAHRMMDKELPPFHVQPITLDGMVPAECIEVEAHTSRSGWIVMNARNPVTGEIELRIEMKRVLFSPQWGTWLRRFMSLASRAAIRLMP